MKTDVAVAALALFAFAAGTGAAELRFGEDIRAAITGTVTLGTGIRTEEPSPQNYGRLAGNRVGRAGGLTSVNSGGPDLNFPKGKPYSTPLKGFVDFDLQRRNFGAFARLKAWYDYELENGDRPYGNHPNGFAQNEPLSDRGFAREAKFKNAMFTDAYLYGRFALANERRLEARFGRQVVNWGTAQFTRGGINVINPRDYAAEQRPGAQPQETRLPVGMLYAELASGQRWGVDGFLPFESRHDVLNGCGTYFNVATYAPTGCNQANVSTTLNEPQALASGVYVHRSADVEARNSGEFGVSLRYAAAALGTEFRVYAMNYHSRFFSVRGTNPNIAGGFGNALTRLTDPNGVKYALIYPEDIHLFGLSFDTRRGQATRVFGEIAYRPNQPLSVNFADLADAFVARNPNSILNRPSSGKAALALPPGATFDAYDRYAVTTASLGVNQGLPGMLGSQRVVLAAELGISHVANLPDASAMRYGRSEAYGVAAVPGVPCTDSYPGKTCSLEGFVTNNAWGYRARVASTYNEAFLGATLTPSLTVAHDVRGNSHDGTFLEGRVILAPALRAQWGRRYFAEVIYTRFTNAPAYSMLIDRDNVQIYTGANF